MSESVYTPSQWGTLFHALPHWEALGAGAAGPGKSLVLLNDPLPQVYVEHQRCMDKQHPHHLRWGDSTGWALHLRRTRPMLEQTLVRAKRIFTAIDPDVKWDAEHYIFTFKSGYRYQFGHCKDPDSADQYMSNQYSFIGFDELVQFEEDQYNQIRTRLRSSDPILSKMLKVRAMSNPMMRRDTNDAYSVKDPFWVRKYFVDPAPEGGVTLRRKIKLEGKVVYRDRIYLRATIDDNPDKDFVEQYKVTLMLEKPHMQQALLYGNWYIVFGAFYADDWLERLHVTDPFPIPGDWPMFRSMDWGFKKPGCVHWYAEDPDGNLFVVRELTFQGKTDEEVADIIKDIEISMGVWNKRTKRSSLTGPADTQLWERRGDMGKSKAQVMHDKGVSWVAADKRSATGGRSANAQRLLKRLRSHKDGTTTPGIVFFKNCRKAITTIPAIPETAGDPETPADGGEDHWHDSILYGCAYASNPIPSRMAEEDEWFEKEEKPPPAKRGRYGYGSTVC